MKKIFPDIVIDRGSCFIESALDIESIDLSDLIKATDVNFVEWIDNRTIHYNKLNLANCYELFIEFAGIGYKDWLTKQAFRGWLELYNVYLTGNRPKIGRNTHGITILFR